MPHAFNSYVSTGTNPCINTHVLSMHRFDTLIMFITSYNGLGQNINNNENVQQSVDC